MDGISGLGRDLLYELVGGGTVYQRESMRKQWGNLSWGRHVVGHITTGNVLDDLGFDEQTALELKLKYERMTNEMTADRGYLFKVICDGHEYAIYPDGHVTGFEGENILVVNNLRAHQVEAIAAHENATCR